MSYSRLTPFFTVMKSSLLILVGPPWNCVVCEWWKRLRKMEKLGSTLFPLSRYLSDWEALCIQKSGVVAVLSLADPSPFSISICPNVRPCRSIHLLSITFSHNLRRKSAQNRSLYLHLYKWEWTNKIVLLYA